MPNTWVISDTHFGHENILKFCNRPFRDEAHMNRTMIERWCHHVKNEDTIYHLGDFGYLKGSQTYKTTEQQMQELLSILPGKKILIRGNHDKSTKRMLEYGFDFVCDSLYLIVEGIAGHGGCPVLLNHYPLREPPPNFSRDGQAPVFVLHGHIHNSKAVERIPHEHKGELVNIPAFNINCSVEMQNYEPITIQHAINRHIERMNNPSFWRDEYRQVPEHRH
jgi:calcineurin-like phosphoesterase family protein